MFPIFQHSVNDTKGRASVWASFTREIDFVLTRKSRGIIQKVQKETPVQTWRINTYDLLVSCISKAHGNAKRPSAKKSSYIKNHRSLPVYEVSWGIVLRLKVDHSMANSLKGGVERRTHFASSQEIFANRLSAREKISRLMTSLSNCENQRQFTASSHGFVFSVGAYSHIREIPKILHLTVSRFRTRLSHPAR